MLQDRRVHLIAARRVEYASKCYLPRERRTKFLRVYSVKFLTVLTTVYEILSHTQFLSPTLKNSAQLVNLAVSVRLGFCHSRIRFALINPFVKAQFETTFVILFLLLSFKRIRLYIFIFMPTQVEEGVRILMMV